MAAPLSSLAIRTLLLPPEAWPQRQSDAIDRGMTAYTLFGQSIRAGALHWKGCGGAAGQTPSWAHERAWSKPVVASDGAGPRLSGRTSAVSTPVPAKAAANAAKVKQEVLEYLVSIGMAGEANDRIVARMLKTRSRPKALVSTVEALRQLGFQEQDIAAMLDKAPSLVSSSPATLVASFEWLADLCGFSYDEMLTAGARAPALLGVPRATIESLVQALKVLELQSSDLKRILVGNPRGITLANVIQAELLQLTTLGFSTEDIRHMLIKQPSLLSSHAASHYKALVARLGSLGVDQTSCKEMVLTAPTLLNVRPKTLSDKLTFITSILKERVDTVVHRPVLLTYSMDRYKQRFQVLQEYGLGHLPLFQWVNKTDAQFEELVERLSSAKPSVKEE